ncbi:332_t:CDS:2 [Paraglomus brasilianum]|uniref:332_t:CDS:1 n=1 Tax=Paraglomus brasilianum TaxID=144538 RepID=A0A9N9ALN1_9GLOM|nr:332_t:CDS:2 [Paraglomus brasilianum]
MQQPPQSLPTPIPQFVVLHDQLQQSWKHPIVHYVFEEEPFPMGMPKDHCVVVDITEDGDAVADVHSYSHRFQVTGCKISSTPQLGAPSRESAASLMLTIEGLTASNNSSDPPQSMQHRSGNADEMDQISNIYGLDELLYDFKRR